jgi:fructuronate reductase
MALSGGDWMIAGVSLRSPDVAAQLNPQDGLYTVAERSAQGMRLSVIGSVAEVIVAAEDPLRVVELLAAPEISIVTLTITEKGYCRAADGSLDSALADEGSVYRFLAQGLARRQAAALSGLTLISCDNLTDNGRQLRRLLLEYLELHDPDLIEWTRTHCTFPSTMVDRIVPATTEADRVEASEILGVRDEGLVVTEPYSQWVIENSFAGQRPAWDRVGAEIVNDVGPYETAKLRMLNGAHSALAYCGLIKGYAHVHEAIADASLRDLADRLMRQEASPMIAAAPGQDLNAYSNALLERFANPALDHKLIQIAMDGSQKIPQRWLATLAANQRRGRRCPAILTAIGAWLRHVRGDNIPRWGAVSDPRAAELAAAWAAHGAKGVAWALFGSGGLMSSEWIPGGDDLAAIALAIEEA